MFFTAVLSAVMGEELHGYSHTSRTTVSDNGLVV